MRAVLTGDPTPAEAAKLEASGGETSKAGKKKKKRKEVTAEQRVEKELQKRYLLQAKAAKRASRRAGGAAPTPGEVAPHGWSAVSGKVN